jgi:hypothetical protein
VSKKPKAPSDFDFDLAAAKKTAERGAKVAPLSKQRPPAKSDLLLKGD